MTYGAHPSDRYSQAAAKSTNVEWLTAEFELSMREHPEDVEVVCAVAIAYAARQEERVRLLERQLAAQEQAVRARLFERTGRVENVVPLAKSKKGKTK